MILDISKLDASKEFETDVCIVGAGAAGIAIAQALTNSDVDCYVVESGSLEFDANTHTLTRTEQVGVDDKRICRLRYFGGSTNHWGGWCMPLSEIDFQPRPWIPYSGWPIKLADLDGYYQAANAICKLGLYKYDKSDYADNLDRLGFVDTTKLNTRFFRISKPPVRFGEVYRSGLREAKNVRVILNANVTSLETNENARTVRFVRAKSLYGHTAYFKAKYFVLACGAVGNAQLLLLSNSVEKAGLGNGFDIVGRFFMQHPHVYCANIFGTNTKDIRDLFREHSESGTATRATIGPSPKVQSDLKILNCSATIHFPTDPSSGYGAAKELIGDIKQGKWPEDSTEKIQDVIKDFDSIVTRLRKGPPVLNVQMRAEQAPNPDSRVMLSSDLDRLGQRTVKMDWQLSEVDWRTIRVAAVLIGEEFGRLSYGRVRLPSWLTGGTIDWPDALWGGCHHIGTTRMADAPRDGVVDRNCRVHSVDNLYIAGSSVFPTSGYANPTLSIVALALRLTDHLQNRLRYG